MSHKPIPLIRVKGFLIMLIYSTLLSSCSTHRYGAYFRDTSKSDPGRIQSNNNEFINTSIANSTGIDNTSLLATLKNEPMIQTNKDIPLNLAHKEVDRSKAFNQLSKIELKAIKREIKEVTSKYRKSSNPENVSTIHEMPRYKYLTWAGGLLLAGILFVALSSSATFLGYLATLAFTASIVFFILWLVKK